jgi:hypothetical protein
MNSKLSLLWRAATVAGLVALAVPALAQAGKDDAAGATKQSADTVSHPTKKKHVEKKATKPTAEKAATKKTAPATGDSTTK